MMSGSAYHYWAISPLQNHVDLAYEMATKWNEPQQNISGLVDLLKTVPAEKINDHLKIVYKPTIELQIAPVIESMNHIL